MKGTCNRSDCGLKDDLPCEAGHVRETDCPHFQLGPGAADLPAPGLADDAIGQRLPWTGRGLGLNDIALASARSPARLVALIGPYNAGKTALLTAMFAHFSKTGLVDGHAFAGSFSLQRWSTLWQYTKGPAASGPMFPPHTPDSSERVPSLLHLAFRLGEGVIRDLLLTDAPGEWFTRWVRDQASEEAKGARWIAEHAHIFLFLVDREGLAGAEVGLVRQNTISLARLLSEHRRGRPIMVVWTKSDGHCDEEIEAPIRARLYEFFGDHPSISTSVADTECLRLLAALLTEAPRAAVLPAPRRPTGTPSAFLAYGETSV